jgi:signal transduction histidine kinase
MTLSSAKNDSLLAWFYNTKLSTKLDLLVVLILIPSLFMTATMVFVAARLQEKSALTTSYRIVLINTGELQTGLLNVETGLRGYALSAEPDFLDPYKLGLEQIKTALETLNQKPFFLSELKEVKLAVDEYLVWVKNQLQLGNLNAQIFKAVVAPAGKVRFDRLRVLLTDLSDKSQKAFLNSRKEVTDLINWIQILPWTLFALIAIGGLLVRRGLQVFVLQPLKLIEQTSDAQLIGDEDLRTKITSPDEIGRLAVSLNASYDAVRIRTEALKRSNADLEQFAYVATHDLQEPLRMISSYTQLLEKRYKGQLDERADQYIHFAVDGANRMQRLIQDLLAFSRLGRQAPKMQPVASGAVLASALRSLEFAAEGATVKVLGQLPVVIADEGQLEQVFTNLIGNALKFRRSGTEHRVEIAAEVESVEEWRFSVYDNGIGIEPAYFERIFTIFQRLNTREVFAGSGIGLSIVKRIIEHHGGRIWLSSQPELGTTFYFTLKAASMQPQRN